jgi:hypothetical protein
VAACSEIAHPAINDELAAHRKGTFVGSEEDDRLDNFLGVATPPASEANHLYIASELRVGLLKVSRIIASTRDTCAFGDKSASSWESQYRFAAGNQRVLFFKRDTGVSFSNANSLGTRRRSPACRTALPRDESDEARLTGRDGAAIRPRSLRNP